MRNWKWLWPVLTSIVILGAGIGAFIYLQKHYAAMTVTSESTLGDETKTKTKVLSNDLKSIIRNNQKKVVQIEVTTPDGTAIGSGFLYNKQGDVITNAHVVEGASKVLVKTSDTKTFQGTVIGIGDRFDVAVVRVADLAGDEPMEISRKKAELTDPVIALGSPLGYQNTATLGTISGVNRTLTDVDTIYQYSDMYQISAPITHGNSGGPLLHQTTGEVLGINSAGYDQGNVAFSIPIVDVIEMVKGWSAHPQLVEGSVTTAETSENAGLNSDSVMEEAEYVVSYFYENLSLHDYVMAYSLLGSSWQSKTDYKSFRTGFLDTLNVQVTDSKSTFSKDKKIATVTVTIEAEERHEDGTKTAVYEATYKVGYENDVLRLLSGSAKKIG